MFNFYAMHIDSLKDFNPGSILPLQRMFKIFHLNAVGVKIKESRPRGYGHMTRMGENELGQRSAENIKKT